VPMTSGASLSTLNSVTSSETRSSPKA
jgi:hypothetical protein